MKIFSVTNTLPRINFKRTCPYFGDNLPDSDEFVKAVRDIDAESLKALHINHFRFIDANSVRGVTLSEESTDVLKKLKECGIERVIDLREDNENSLKYAQNCANVGLKYFNFQLNPKATSFVVQQLPKFFKAMNDGRCYIACYLGLHRTDFAVTLNYLLNPKEPVSPPTLTHIFMPGEPDYTEKYIDAVKKFISNLSMEDRNKLKLPQNLNSRVTKLLTTNVAKFF